MARSQCRPKRHRIVERGLQRRRVADVEEARVRRPLPEDAIAVARKAAEQRVRVGVVGGREVDLEPALSLRERVPDHEMDACSPADPLVDLVGQEGGRKPAVVRPRLGRDPEHRPHVAPELHLRVVDLEELRERPALGDQLRGAVELVRLLVGGGSDGDVRRRPPRRLPVRTNADRPAELGEPDRGRQLGLAAALGEDDECPPHEPLLRLRVVLVQAVDDLPLPGLQKERLPEEVALPVHEVLLDPAADNRAEGRRELRRGRGGGLGLVFACPGSASSGSARRVSGSARRARSRAAAARAG